MSSDLQRLMENSGGGGGPVRLAFAFTFLALTWRSMMKARCKAKV